MAEDRYTRITLRIPKEVHKALQEAADARSHSMNAEIVQRLEESFEGLDSMDSMDSPEFSPKLDSYLRELREYVELMVENNKVIEKRLLAKDELSKWDKKVK